MRPTLCLLAVSANLVAAWTELHHEPFMNKNIDPIVVPGTYTSHMHTFFGSDAVTNVLPTSSDLQNGCYSGQNANDLSVYWIPTLYYVDGDTFTEVPVFYFSTYYTNAFAEISIPQDFAMISGNASAQTQAEADHPSNGLEWFLRGVSLRFPNCVNLDNLAEYDWSDDSNKCPESMKAIPQLRYAARYDTKAVVPNGWSGDAPFQLSCGSASGNGYCFHGDFINGWYEDSAENMLASGGGGYEDGQFISGEHGSAAADSGCTPTDQDPDNGTSDYYTSLEMMNGGAAVADAVNATSVPVTTAAQPTSFATASPTLARGRRVKTRTI
ncbi:hypothetical protein FOXG_16780 [Fusarium oxysporum f. sp. lycopersici 4287]|uniref:DUF1996 domain-containing protein n=1 Tax=Fusarium oxysporum f. sp. lycopersici (strain 4287 / CBS 123668 / FGSC 9935 / NRRL 34936) TaxID=426428 RepID=A0A0J9W885_FUSO4|nr:hypothetical protein FOXG_16712 [Fusarium oxysporum f. sp. lycopersici 4287]XP_018257563.1 hypothetical protein FOXG_16780 [Fusarium oxysporum f. sp. lycopersici 4287]KNB19429.1 hypothetical protein FOXG_16712 [Fusarium oxysporum f. sp. lycopersici 4287]KNB19518.1 hypothetical protein FOXG_16780 [Fusarium oxysporum f. sp. lycopersici 4287]